MKVTVMDVLPQNGTGYESNSITKIYSNEYS
jgi:hypothetical protein